MTAAPVTRHSARVPPWRDIRVLRAAGQLVVVALVLLVAYLLWTNLATNMTSAATATPPPMDRRILRRDMRRLMRGMQPLPRCTMATETLLPGPSASSLEQQMELSAPVHGSGWVSRAPRHPTGQEPPVDQDRSGEALPAPADAPESPHRKLRESRAAGLRQSLCQSPRTPARGAALHGQMLENRTNHVPPAICPSRR